MPGDNPSTLSVQSVLDRIDDLTQHIIEIKGDMYRRADFKDDAARIYDHIGSIQTQVLMTLKESVLALEKRIDDKASLGLVQGLDIQVRGTVPREEHEARWAVYDRKFTIVDSRLATIERRLIPPAVIAGVSGLLGIIGTALAQGPFYNSLAHFFHSR